MRNPFLSIITIVFFTTFLFLISSIFLSIRTSNNLYKSYGMVEHTYQVINQLESLHTNVFKGSADARGYYISKIPDLKKKYAEDTITIYGILNNLKLLTQDNQVQQKNIHQLKSLLEKRFALTVYLWIHGNYKKETVQSAFDQTNNSNNKILTIILQMTDLEKKLLVQRKSKALFELSRNKNYILLSAISVVLIGFLYIMMVKKDINRRRNLENKLVELNDNKIKFFSIISHDLRGPAYATQQLTEMIKDSQNLSPAEKDTLTGMLFQSIKKVTSLLDDLLEWSRVQMNHIEYNPQMINLKNIVRETVDHFRSQLESKRINVQNLLDENCEAFGDKYMTSTILRNLLSNAIKFTKEDKSIFISCKLNNLKVMEVKVSDEGVGMSNKIKEKLFDIGVRTSTKGTAHETGTGLGLVLVKEFVEKQGGKIRVESEEGKGSTFIFTIPVSAPTINKAQREPVKRNFFLRKSKKKSD